MILAWRGYFDPVLDLSTAFVYGSSFRFFMCYPFIPCATKRYDSMIQYDKKLRTTIRK